MDRLVVITCCLSLWNSRARGTRGAGAPRRQLHTCPGFLRTGNCRGDRYFQAGAFRAWLGTPCVGLPPALHRQPPLCSDNPHPPDGPAAPLLALPFTDLGKPAPRDLALSLYLLIKTLSMWLFVLPTQSSTIYNAFLSVTNHDKKSG